MAAYVPTASCAAPVPQPRFGGARTCLASIGTVDSSPTAIELMDMHSLSPVRDSQHNKTQMAISAIFSLQICGSVDFAEQTDACCGCQVPGLVAQLVSAVAGTPRHPGHPRRQISLPGAATTTPHFRLLQTTFLVPPAPRKGSLVVGGRPAAVPTEHRRRHAVPTPSCELASLAIITKVVPGWKVVCSKELRLELKSWDLATPSSHPPLTCPLYSLIATSDFFDTPDTPTVSIPRLSSL